MYMCQLLLSINSALLLVSGGAGSGVRTRGFMIAREKKFGRVRLSTNALNINMTDVLSIVVTENLSWSSSVNRLLLLFILTFVNLDLLWRESQTSWMESKRLVEESLTSVSTCLHLMENLLMVFNSLVAKQNELLWIVGKRR